ncbi:MAG: GNAT family N-acetyltransferase [Burkholderiales bacterium]|nr:GNAT family N-acetyltransferase [Burkholderiales bacterium]
MLFEFIHTTDTIDWQALAALYKAADMGEKPVEDLQISFGNSMYKCFAYHAGELIGVGRGLADGRDCAYLCDVAVHPTYQGQGVGRQIIGKLLDLSAGHKKRILYAVPGKEGFYKTMGFSRMQTAMAIFPDQAHAIENGFLSEQ